MPDQLPDSPGSVHVIESLPLHAVLQRNFDLAEQRGQVLDLTSGNHSIDLPSSPGSVEFVESPPLQAQQRDLTEQVACRQEGVVDLTARERNTAGTSTAIAPPETHPTSATPNRQERLGTQHDDRLTSEPATVATPLHQQAVGQIIMTSRMQQTAQVVTTSPTTLANFYCQKCPARVRERWMKLCSACHQSASNKQQQQGRAIHHNPYMRVRTQTPPPALRATQVTTPPRRQGASMPQPLELHGESQTVTQSPKSPLPPTDDGLQHPTRHAQSAHTNSNQSRGRCRFCHRNVRHEWMALCSQCYFDKPQQSGRQHGRSHCLACHCPLRDPWMTWCSFCYEVGVLDGEEFDGSVDDVD